MYDSVVILAYIFGNTFAAQNGCKPKDCYDLKCYKVSTGKDGPHTVYPGTADLPHLQVSCDQETDGGGWMIYQRRVDGSVDFERNWLSYREGFGIIGNDTTEMWMGNENVFQMLQAYEGIECELRIEATSFDGDSCWATCYPFQMRPESSKYSMTWDTVEESIPELIHNLGILKDVEFSTFDEYSCDRSCVTNYKGGWWFKRCAAIFFNGVYIPNRQTSDTSIFVSAFKGKTTFQKSCMMFRPIHKSRVCTNPCKNDGACAYVTATVGYICMCTSDFCGAHCETARPCKNGTCVYNTATKTNTWKCVDTLSDSGISGTTFQDGDISHPRPAETVLQAMVLIILLILMLILAGFLYYKSQQRDKEDAEDAEEDRLLSEEEELEDWLSLVGLPYEPVFGYLHRMERDLDNDTL